MTPILSRGRGSPTDSAVWLIADYSDSISSEKLHGPPFAAKQSAASGNKGLVAAGAPSCSGEPPWLAAEYSHPAKSTRQNRSYNARGHHETYSPPKELDASKFERWRISILPGPKVGFEAGLPTPSSHTTGPALPHPARDSHTSPLATLLASHGRDADGRVPRKLANRPNDQRPPYRKLMTRYERT